MAFANPDLNFALERWPTIDGFVRDAFARLGPVAAKLNQMKARVAAAVVAVAGRFERADAAPVRSVSAAAVAQRPMTLAEQWSKISAILERSVDGARVATDKQSAATQQLDLAQYGLITLVDELSAVMALPGRRSRTATVHAFSGAPLCGNVHALAA